MNRWLVAQLRHKCLFTRDEDQARRSLFEYAPDGPYGEWTTSPLGMFNGVFRRLTGSAVALQVWPDGHCDRVFLLKP